MPRATVVLNPMARNAPAAERIVAAAAPLRDAGWLVEVVSTEAAGHATELAREAAAAGSEVVFACGGDGTVNEVVNGLAGGAAALGVLRGGMGDVFAKELRLKKDPADSLRLLLEGRRRRFDLGSVNGRYFLCMAGVGFDAQVVRSVPSGPKKRLGSTSYALWGARELVRYSPQTVELRLDGELREAELYWLLLGNTRSYGGVLDITSTATVDDGLLESYVFGGSGAVWLAATALRLAMRRHDGARGVAFQKLHRLEVLTPGLPLQADGEYLGETPATFTAEPAALDVLLPSGGAGALFSHPEPLYSGV